MEDVTRIVAFFGGVTLGCLLYLAFGLINEAMLRRKERKNLMVVCPGEDSVRSFSKYRYDEVIFADKKDGKPAIVTLNPCSKCHSNAGIIDMSVDIVADCDGYIKSASSSVRCQCGNFVDGPSAPTQEQSIVEAAKAWNRHNQQPSSNGKD